VKYFKLAKNYKALINAYTQIHNYDALEKLIQKIPEGSKELVHLGD